MEPSGRNQWQPVANGTSPENGSNKPKPLPPVATSCRSERMVRRGSTVRVRQRALQNPRKSGSFRSMQLAQAPVCGGYGADYGAFGFRTRLRQPAPPTHPRVLATAQGERWRGCRIDRPSVSICDRRRDMGSVRGCPKWGNRPPPPNQVMAEMRSASTVSTVIASWTDAPRTRWQDGASVVKGPARIGDGQDAILIRWQPLTTS